MSQKMSQKMSLPCLSTFSTNQYLVKMSARHFLMNQYFSICQPDMNQYLGNTSVEHSLMNQYLGKMSVRLVLIPLNRKAALIFLQYGMYTQTTFATSPQLELFTKVVAGLEWSALWSDMSWQSGKVCFEWCHDDWTYDCDNDDGVLTNVVPDSHVSTSGCCCKHFGNVVSIFGLILRWLAQYYLLDQI